MFAMLIKPMFALGYSTKSANEIREAYYFQVNGRNIKDEDGKPYPKFPQIKDVRKKSSSLFKQFDFARSFLDAFTHGFSISNFNFVICKHFVF
jgi:hypothetical protein